MARALGRMSRGRSGTLSGPARALIALLAGAALALSLGCTAGAPPAGQSSAARSAAAIPASAPESTPAQSTAAAPDLPETQTSDEPVGPLRQPAPAEPPKYVEGTLEPGATVLLRHDLAATRRLVYAGVRGEEILAGVGDEDSPAGSLASVAHLDWRLARRHLIVASAGGAPGTVHSNSVEDLTGANQAGRDALAAMRERPWGGHRLSADSRRISDRGVEPLPSDRSTEQLIEPLPELPRLPRARLSASGPVVEMAGPYRIEWRLAGAGTFGGDRKCWRVLRGVSTPAGARVPPGEALDFRDEYLFDAGDSTVLRLSRTSSRPVGGLGQVGELLLSLVEEKREDAAAARREAEETAAISRLLEAIALRRPDEAARLAAELERDGRGGAAVAIARKFAAGEQALAEARAGQRRVELVPENTFVLIGAPAKLPAGGKLVPVVFFHGAGAGPERYFRDWSARAGDRPLLLVFPRSRDWTWRLDQDPAVVGSLLEQLGRTYDLDRERLVLAGHGLGAELAFALAYGAEFPGFRVRGVVAAGGTMRQQDQNMKRLRSLASDGKHEELAARVRSTDVLALAGEKDELYPLKDFQNTDRWLRSFNPKGVTLLGTPGLGQQYSPDWTPVILDWIGKLGPVATPAPAPATDGHR